jgi:hypothetical protein
MLIDGWCLVCRLCGADSCDTWKREARRIIPILPRARPITGKLSHHQHSFQLATRILIKSFSVISVLNPECFFSDPGPDPTFDLVLVLDPDPASDPT